MPSQAERYRYGKGRLMLAEVVAGVVGEYIWQGDVSQLNFGFAEERVKHRESYSGQNSVVRDFGSGTDLTVNWTMNDDNLENTAPFVRGSLNATAAGTVTSENLPNPIVVGTEYILANPGISSLVITDSAGTPAEVPSTHYEYDPRFGSYKFNSLPGTPAWPFKAAYSYAARKQVALLNANEKVFALRYQGVNLAEGGAPEIVEFYKMSAGLLQQLELITSGNALAGKQVTGTVLADTTKLAGGVLGRYGRIIQVGAAA